MTQELRHTSINGSSVASPSSEPITENPDGSHTAHSAWISQGIKWGDSSFGSAGGVVTWSFAELNLPGRLSFSQQVSDALKDDARNAFKAWQDIANITFEEVSDSSEANIRLGMNNIDGAQGTLGIAYYTYMGSSFVHADIELDSSENWSGNLPYLTFLHEIGHAIGLDHEDRLETVMSSIIPTQLTGLTPDDIEGITRIYGAAIPTAPVDILASTNTTAVVGINQNYTGLIDFAADQDWIKVQLFAGVDYTFELNDNTQNNLALSSINAVHDHRGAALNTTTAAQKASSAPLSLTFQAQTSGDHYISVSDASSAFSAPADYTLSVNYQDSTRYFTASDAKSVFHGGEEIDYALYPLLAAQATVFTNNTSNSTLISHNGVLDELTDIERLQFLDQNIALDINGNAGQAYRLYQAAFDRVPDQEGLGYWIDELDNNSSLENISHSFINSAEFQNLYGAAPSNETFISLLYANVLDRTPDQAGFDYWINDISNGATHAGVLASFSESAENKANVIGQIESGIAYEQWIT